MFAARCSANNLANSPSNVNKPTNLTTEPSLRNRIKIGCKTTTTMTTTTATSTTTRSGGVAITTVIALVITVSPLEQF